MRKVCVVVLVALTLLSSFGMSQDSDSSVRQALIAKYKLTRPTMDGTDVDVPGSLLILKQTNLVAAAKNASNYVPSNAYKDGRITQAWSGHTTMHREGMRGFDAGDKFWVTNISVSNSGAIFDLFSDAYQGQHYKASCPSIGQE